MLLPGSSVVLGSVVPVFGFPVFGLLVLPVLGLLELPLFGLVVLGDFSSVLSGSSVVISSVFPDSSVLPSSVASFSGSLVSSSFFSSSPVEPDKSNSLSVSGTTSSVHKPDSSKWYSLPFISTFPVTMTPSSSKKYTPLEPFNFTTPDCIAPLASTKYLFPS